MDYSVIKCYLFHVFERRTAQRGAEAFARELLRRAAAKCLALAEDAAAFLLNI